MLAWEFLWPHLSLRELPITKRANGGMKKWRGSMTRHSSTEVFGDTVDILSKPSWRIINALNTQLTRCSYAAEIGIHTGIAMVASSAMPRVTLKALAYISPIFTYLLLSKVGSIGSVLWRAFLTQLLTTSKVSGVPLLEVCQTFHTLGTHIRSSLTSFVEG